MGTHRKRSTRRTHLFLVRLWVEDTPGVVGAGSGGDRGSTRDREGTEAWSGRVQRVVDGEAHPFQGWQSLTDTLLAMLSETTGNPEK